MEWLLGVELKLNPSPYCRRLNKLNNCQHQEALNRYSHNHKTDVFIQTKVIPELEIVCGVITINMCTFVCLTQPKVWSYLTQHLQTYQG